MKKFILLISGLFIFVFDARSQSNGDVTIIDLSDHEKDVFVWGMSSDGNYITGYINGQLNSFIWDKSNGIIEFDAGMGNSAAYAVSNNGIIAGEFLDTTYTYVDKSVTDDTLDLFSGGYYTNSKWNSLGIRPGIEVTSGSASRAEAISADGSIIAGGWTTSLDEGIRKAPVVWTISGETLSHEILSYVDEGNGAMILAMSADGSIFGGWADYAGKRFPVLWINGAIKYITHEGFRLEGEVMGISPNGRYAALWIEQDAAVYDINEDKLTIIPNKEGAYSTKANAVSDNGTVIGFHSLGFFLSDREGFIYTEQLGSITIKNYLTKLGISIPATMTFGHTSGISADGSKIAGFGQKQGQDGYMYSVGFYIEISQPLTGLNPPKNLFAEETSISNVELIWDAADADATNTFGGYNIYRNNLMINTTPLTNNNHIDTSLANGSYIYKVTAVWNTNEESVASNEAKVNTALLSVPFYDDFSSSSLETKFWNTSIANSNRWATTENGIPINGMVYTVPVGNAYDESLLSAHIDATAAADLYLSFNIAIPVEWYSYQYDHDQMEVQVSDGSSWNTIDTYNPYSNQSGQAFEYKTYDISDYVNDTIRLRFRASGNNIGGPLDWYFDNVKIYTSADSLLVEKPLKVNAYKEANGDIRINWVDPNDVVNLSYLEDENPVGGIGNEGVSFIAAIMFDSNDLKELNGYKIVSISADLYRVDGVQDSALYKLVAFQGTNRVLYQDIDSYIIDWNVFTLDNPIIIDSSKSLYIGLEVTRHETNDWPIRTCLGRQYNDGSNTINVNDGKSNLISEDAGTTWQTLTDYGITESLAITAFVENTDNSTPKEQLMGYKIYRNDENILDIAYETPGALTILNNFADIYPLTDEDACYQVSAYYNTQQESEKTNPICLYISREIQELKPQNNATGAYLNTEVSVIFNVNITANDLNGITIKDNNNNNVSNVYGEINGKTLRINHPDFAANTTYTATVPSGIIDRYDSEITWSFTTGTTLNIPGSDMNKTTIYPNPSTGLFYINITKPSFVRVIDLTGKVLKTYTLSSSSTVDLRPQAAGIYFIQVKTETGTSTHKVIIQ